MNKSNIRGDLKTLLMLVGILSIFLGIYHCIITEYHYNSYGCAYEESFVLDEGAYKDLNTGDILRFHVLANSNTAKDQEIKVQLRNVVLDEIEGLMGDSEEFREALHKLSKNKEKINLSVEKFMDQQGYDYEVETSLDKKLFPTRQYKNGVLEGGRYYALEVVIGKGRGDNYWCVLFPPLCYVDLVVNEDDNKKEEQQNNGEQEDPGNEKEIRFVIIEWFKDLLQ